MIAMVPSRLITNQNHILVGTKLQTFSQIVLRSGRVGAGLRPIDLAALRVPSISRLYSTPPHFKSEGNLLVNSINYVKDVDKFQQDLSKAASEEALAKQLMSRISHSPELLYLLLMFHHELALLGITPASNTISRYQVWKYRLAYVLKLARIHDVFWTQCHQQEISQRTHRLGFLPSTIGVLSPLNFEVAAYRQLQTGEFEGVNFKDVEILGRRTFD